MPRTATQRANRCIRKASRPSISFPFTELPGELQLLVLCNCDLRSVGILLRLSPRVRSLFLCYPEATIQGIFQIIPQPLANYLRLSLELGLPAKHTFNADEVLNLLRSKSLEDWLPADQRILQEVDDPVHIIHELVTTWIEMDIAIVVIAQGMHASIEALAFPYVQRGPCVLSELEYRQFACGVLVQRIYYQLHRMFQISFATDDDDEKRQFPNLFVQSLQPWQLEQVLSIERFFYVCLEGSCYGNSMFGYIDAKYTCTSSIAKKSAFFRAFQSHARGDDFHWTFFASVAEARSFNMHRNLQPHEQGDGRTAILSEATESTSSGWRFLHHAASDFDLAHIRSRLGNYHLFRRGAPSLGILFWDDKRLAQWDVHSRHDLLNLYEIMVNGMYYPQLFANPTPFWWYQGTVQARAREYSLARSLVQWTRAPVQCTLKEFLYQHVALKHMEEGVDILPEESIEPGAVCWRCDMDGHTNCNLPLMR